MLQNQKLIKNLCEITRPTYARAANELTDKIRTKNGEKKRSKNQLCVVSV